MSRGILATIYVRLQAGVGAPDLQAALERAYEGEPFVHVLPFKSLPATRHVRGTNLCLIGGASRAGCRARRSWSASSTTWSRAPPARRSRT